MSSADENVGTSAFSSFDFENDWFCGVGFDREIGGREVGQHAGRDTANDPSFPENHRQRRFGRINCGTGILREI